MRSAFCCSRVTAVAPPSASGSSSPSSSATPAGPGGSGTIASTAAGGASASGGLTNVTLGYVPYSDDASLFYAQDSGIFRRTG